MGVAVTELVVHLPDGRRINLCARDLGDPDVVALLNKGQGTVPAIELHIIEDTAGEMSAFIDNARREVAAKLNDYSDNLPVDRGTEVRVFNRLHRIKAQFVWQIYDYGLRRMRYGGFKTDKIEGWGKKCEDTLVAALAEWGLPPHLDLEPYRDLLKS